MKKRGPREPHDYDPRGGVRTSEIWTGPWNPGLVRDYDRVADSYTEAYFDELSRKPFDREVLDRFVRDAAGRVCDLGCGPGQIARYLHDRGVEAFGIDLSPRMVELARRLSPSIHFDVGDMTSLNIPSKSLGGIVSFYSVIHLQRHDLRDAFAEMLRVLRPAGHLSLAFHCGTGEVHADEWFGQRVSLDATFFEPAEVAEHLVDVGFAVNDTLTRKPYEFELQTERVYILATSAAA